MSQQLTESDRAILALMLTLKMSRAQIARRLNVHRTTVWRELKRNSSSLGYHPDEAQQKAEIRRNQPRRTAKMNDHQVRDYVCRRLKWRWSPDQIAGRSRREFADRNRQISHQTIYHWINQQASHERRQWRQYLRRGYRWRNRRQQLGRLTNTISIEGRPLIVDRRRRFGDWEGDTIVGRGKRGGLLSLVERKSGYTLLARVDDLRSQTVRLIAKQKLCRLPAYLRRTMTFDNGKEFAQHERLAADAKMAIYFARPYSAWQRGTNENTNGLVRQYLPKGTDLIAESHRAVAAIETSLNDRPRKRLDYLTPREILDRHAARRGVAFEF